ncbi:MAG: DUF3987 domain-containing protein [Xanthomonadales bacterium]|nr:DUF3987 domain-containing protein [Xanthomonadales bacterium]
MNAVPKPESPKDAARRLAAGALREGYRPEALHEYRDADGAPLFWRIRLKRADGAKWIRPMFHDGGVYRIGEPPAPPAGKPPYLLPELSGSDPSAPVIVVEGEWAADHLHALGMLATTSGSADSADAADWSPLAGRRVIVWPDHDGAGAKYAEAVADRLRALGCAVAVIDAGALGLPAKGDAVDWLARHPDARAADVLALPNLPAMDHYARARGATPLRFPTHRARGGDGDAPAPSDPAYSEATPQPLPSPLPDVPAFRADLLPEAVRVWCEDAAEGLQVPLDFTAVPAMIGLAGAIGRSVGMAMKRRSPWIERPMLWGCVIGRPSSGKSPALAPTRRMLDRLAGEEREAYEAAQREHEARAMVAEATRANAKDAIRKAVKAGDAAAAQAEADAALFDEAAPTEPRIVANDATVEKLGELLNANPRGLVQFRDELAGWLASLDREGREGDRAFWLECWNGSGSYTVDRIGRGTIRIEACAMSILGGMQPGKLGEYVRGAVRGGFADDGLIQRLQLAVYPDLPTGWRYVDRAPDPHAERQAWQAFQRLRALDPGSVGAEHPEGCDVPFLRFDDEAQGLFAEWHTAHMERLRAGDEPAWLESHFAKYPALVGRLALVLHLADGHGGPVRADTLARALNWCEYLAGHARRIYAPAADGGLTGAHLLLKRRADLGDSFTARDVYRRHWSGLADAEAVEAAIDALTEYHHLRTVPPEPGLGRPSVTYAWTA